MNINQWSLRVRLTIGIVVLTALGFTATFFGASNALKGYLVDQIDNELMNVAGSTAMRLDRGAALANDEDDFPRKRHNEREEAIPTPLQRIPTTLSLTLLSADGVVQGALGGDLTTYEITDYLVGFDKSKATATNGKPFTIKAKD